MITVILATWNGARSIGRTLDAFVGLEPPAAPWRLIAVDNGSTDETPRLLEDYCDVLPMTILRETRPGKSCALNLALQHVDEGLVVFVDDDILPDPGWLREYEAVAAARPDHDLFAGRIAPLWETAPPEWLKECVDLDACYGIHVERPEGPCPSHLLYGGNMAIRAEAIGAHRFDESYGPFDVPQFAMGGETEFVGRLAAADRKSWFCRDAVVYHAIPARHQEPAWLLNRAANFGRGQFRVDADPLYSARGGFRTTVLLRLAMGAARLRGLAAGLRGNEAAAFRARWRSSYLAGFAAELETARREADRGGPAAARDPKRQASLDPRPDQAG